MWIGLYLYDYRFLIVGFCIIGYGVIKIVNVVKNKSKLLCKFLNVLLDDLFGYDFWDVSWGVLNSEWVLVRVYFCVGYFEEVLFWYL